MIKPEDTAVTGPGQPTGKSFKDSLPALPSEVDKEQFRSEMEKLETLERGQIPTDLGRTALTALETLQPNAAGIHSDRMTFLSDSIVGGI